MHSLFEDVRFSFRLVRKRPGMSLLVLAALALGIGVNCAVFSVVNAVLLRPVPLAHPEQIVFVYAKSQQSSTLSVSYPEFKDWQEQSRSFQSMAALESNYFNLTGNGPPEHLKGLAVTASYFQTLGVVPAIGRDFTKGDEVPGAARVAVISHGLWERRFGGDPAVLGKTLVLDGQPYTIVGVLPASQFTYVQFWDVWVGAGPFLNQHMMSRETRYFFVLGRLAASATTASAQSEMEAIASRLTAEYPQSNKNIGINIQSLVGAFTSGGTKPLWLMQVAAGLIFLLACVNVVTVFIAGAIERRKELSIRLALGATRFAVLRQLLVQSLGFAAVGAGAGLLAAEVGLVYLVDKFPFAVGRFQETDVDHTVLWFTIGLAIIASLLATILPSLYVSRLNISSELKGEWSWSALSKYRTVAQGALIVFEIALAAGLSIVSALLIKSYYQTERVDLGFDPHGVLSFQVSLPKAQYGDDAAKARFYDQVIQKVRTIPGVQSATASYTLPLGTPTHWINLQVDATSPLAGQRPFVDESSVLPDYFRSMKIPILQGREFTDSDRPGSPPVAIVDKVLASRMWPGQSALGKRLRLADISDNGPPWREVVGVVGQVRYYGPERGIMRSQVYTPAYQHPVPSICFIVNTSIRAAGLQSPIENAVHSIDAELPVDNFSTLDDYFDRIEGGREVSLLLLSSFAAIGIILGMIGIYGVVSNSIVRRRREIAIRMALGSSVRRCILLVTKLGLLAASVGIAVGSLIVFALTKILSSFLFGVKPLDPGVYILSILVVAALASIASLISIGAVLRLQPQDVLRE